MSHQPNTTKAEFGMLSS